MPNRIIKESIRTSKSVNSLTDFQFRLWLYLITYVDDYGRGSADPELLKGFVFPRRKGVTEAQIEKALAELATFGMITLYEVDGESFFLFPTWSEHQRIQTKKSKFPEPDESTVIHRESPPESNTNTNTNPNTNPNTKRKKQSFTPPTLKEVENYCRERGNKVDAKRFFDFFEASGWIDSKGKPVQNWKQKVITWEGYSSHGETAKGKNFTVSNDPNKFEKIDMDELSKLVDMI